MGPPEEWSNPVTASAGEVQRGVDPARLRPSRADLIRARFEFQRSLLRSGRPRFTMIQVNREGVIVDGHHAVRAAAEEARPVDVTVSPLPVVAISVSILDLPVS
jgi:hypothetical protein